MGYNPQTGEEESDAGRAGAEPAWAGPRVRRDVAQNPVVPSAPADAESEAGLADAPLEQGGGVVPPAVQPEPAFPVLGKNDARNIAALQHYGAAVDQFDAKRMLAGQRAARQSSNAAVANEYRGRGVRYAKDDEGAVQPLRDENGSVIYQPKKLPVEYDDKGHAIQPKREETGVVSRTELDKDAEIGPHPDRPPNELYRQNKHSAWDYVGTIDEAAASNDPALKAAAKDAQLGVDKRLHAAVGEDLGETINQAATALQGKAREVQGKGAQLVQLQTQRDAITPEQTNQQEGGLFGTGIGRRPTQGAIVAQQKAADLDKQIADLRDAGYTADPKQQAALLKPEKEALAQAHGLRRAWTTAVPREPGDFDRLLQERTDSLAESGGDPASDPILTALQKRKAALGLGPPSQTTAGSSGGGAAGEDAALRKDPLYGPVLAERDQVQSEHEAAINKANSIIGPVRAQLEEGDAQLEPVRAQAAAIRGQLYKLVGMQPEEGSDENLNQQELSDRLAALEDPAARGAASELLHALEPVSQQLQTGETELGQLRDQHETLSKEAQAIDAQFAQRHAAVQQKLAVVGAVKQTQRDKMMFDALRTSFQAAADLSVSNPPEAAAAVTQELKAAPHRPIHDVVQKIKGFFYPLFGPNEQQQQEVYNSVIKNTVAEKGLIPSLSDYVGEAASIPNVVREIALISQGKPVNAENLEEYKQQEREAVGLTANPKDSKPWALTKGVANSLLNAAEGLVNPAFLAMPSSRVLSGYFAAQQLSQLPDAISRIRSENTLQGKVEASVDAAVDLLAGGFAAKHAMDTRAMAQASRKTWTGSAETAEMVRDAIKTAKREGVSPEFRAFFGGIDPAVAGTTPEKVAAFAKSLGMEWKPSSPVPEPETAAGGGVEQQPAPAQNVAPPVTKPTPEEAHGEIDNLQVGGATPEVNTATQHALRGLVKLAGGQPLESLTTVERGALEATEKGGRPRYEMVKGPDGKKVAVITQATLDNVAKVAPNVRAMLPESEEAQRQAILQPENVQRPTPNVQRPSAEGVEKIAPKSGTVEQASAQSNKKTTDVSQPEPKTIVAESRAWEDKNYGRKPENRSPLPESVKSIQPGTVVKSAAYRSEGEITITGPAEVLANGGISYPANFPGTGRRGGIHAKHIDEIVSVPEASNKTASENSQNIPTFHVEVQNAKGQTRVVEVAAADENAARAQVAQRIPAGAMIRDVTAAAQPARAGEAAPGNFEEKAVAQVRAEKGEALSGGEERIVRAVARTLQPHYERWQRAFSAVNFTLAPHGSGGAGSDSGTLALNISIPDVVAHARQFTENKEHAAHVMSEEAIHSVTTALEDRDPETGEARGSIDLVKIYRALPEKVRNAMRGAYKASDTEYALAHEFWRMFMQGQMELARGGRIRLKGKFLQEQTSRQFVVENRKALAVLMRFFRNMDGELRKSGAEENVLGEVKRATDLIQSKIKEVDGHAVGQSEEVSDEVHTKQASPAMGTTARGPPEPSGGETTVARAGEAGQHQEAPKSSVDEGKTAGGEAEPAAGEELSAEAGTGGIEPSARAEPAPEPTPAERAKKSLNEASEITAARKGVRTLGVRSPAKRLEEAITAAHEAKIPVTADALVRYILSGKFDEPAKPSEIQPAGDAGAAAVESGDAKQPGAEGSVPAGTVPVVGGGDGGGTAARGTEDRVEAAKPLGNSITLSGEEISLAGEWKTKNPRGSEIFTGKWALVPLRLLKINAQHGAAQDRIDRERTGAAQRHEIISNLTAENVDIAWGASPTLNDGAPIITPDGSVEVGNNRAMAVRDLYANHPEKARIYDAFAHMESARLGLPALSGGEPVALVRVAADRGGLSQQDFVKASNTAGTEQRSVAETALADRKLFADATLTNALNPNEDGSFNREFLTAFYNGVGAPKELRFEDGTPDDGKIERRAQAALLAHLLGGASRTGIIPGVDRVLSSLMDNIQTPGIRQVVSGLAKAGPAIVGADAVNPELSIVPNLGRALTTLLDYRLARERGEVRTVADYFSQGKLSLDRGAAAPPTLDPLDLRLLDLLANAKSVKAVVDPLLRYAKAVTDYGDPNQSRFFGDDEPPDAAAVLKAQKTSDEREMLWDVSQKAETLKSESENQPSRDPKEWARIYRKLFELEKSGTKMTPEQRKMFDQAEAALGQKLMFGDETKGQASLAQFKAKWSEEPISTSAKATEDSSAGEQAGLFDEKGAVGRMPYGEEQGTLFAQATARDPSINDRDWRLFLAIKRGAPMERVARAFAVKADDAEKTYDKVLAAARGVPTLLAQPLNLFDRLDEFGKNRAMAIADRFLARTEKAGEQNEDKNRIRTSSDTGGATDDGRGAGLPEKQGQIGRAEFPEGDATERVKKILRDKAPTAGWSEVTPEEARGDEFWMEPTTGEVKYSVAALVKRHALVREFSSEETADQHISAAVSEERIHQSDRAASILSGQRFGAVQKRAWLIAPKEIQSSILLLYTDAAGDVAKGAELIRMMAQIRNGERLTESSVPWKYQEAAAVENLLKGWESPDWLEAHLARMAEISPVQAITRQPVSTELPDRIQAQSLKAGSVPEKVTASSVDSPAQGELVQAREIKARTWKNLQDLRQKVKEAGPQAGNLRLELLQAGSAHREAVRREQAALQVIERRANELGQTTLAAQPTSSTESVSAEGSRKGSQTPAELFQEGLPTAMAIASNYQNIPGVDLKDVQQHARIALVRAAREYDPAKGASLNTFAGRVVENELRSLYGKMNRTAGRESVSLDETAEDSGQGTEDSRKDRIMAPDDTRRAVEEADGRRILGETISELPERMQGALAGILEGKTFDQIGDELGGISRQAVQRLAVEGMRRVRGKLGERGIAKASDLLSQAIHPDGKQPKEYDKSSTQVTLSKEEARPFVDFANAIPKGELYVDPADPTFGRETEPHVTALYGITDANPRATAKALLETGITNIQATVGKLSIFKTEKYDVLKADIESPQLHAINAALKKAVPFESDFPDYTPHLTIAYLKHGEGKKYVGDARFEGTPLNFSELDFRSKDGRKFSIDMNTPDPARAVSVYLSLLDSRLEHALSAQATDDPVAQLMSVLDDEALGKLIDQALNEKRGEFVTGRPDLTLGAEGAPVRAAHQMHTDTWEGETIAQWDKIAEEHLADPTWANNFADEIVRRYVAGDTLRTWETRAALKLLADGSHAMDGPEQTLRQAKRAFAFARIGATQAQEFAARRDPLKTPEERGRAFLSENLFRLPPEKEKAIDALPPAERDAAVDTAMKERLDQLEQAFRYLTQNSGLTINDIFNGAWELHGKGKKLIEQGLSGYNVNEQHALKLCQTGTRTPAEISKMSGLGEKRVREINDKFISELKEKLRSKVAGGLSLEGLDLEGALLAQEVRAGRAEKLMAQRTNEEVEAELDRIVRGMGFVPSGDLGKYKVAKRKTRKPIYVPPKPSAAAGKAPDDSPVPFEPRKQNQLPFTPEHAMRNVDSKGGNAVPTGKILGQIALPLYSEMMIRKGADMGDPVDVAKIARIAQATNGNRFDMAFEFVLANLLSNPTTHFAYKTSILGHSAFEHTMQRGVEALTNLVLRDPGSASFKEFKYLRRALLPSIVRGWRTGVEQWSTETDMFDKEVMDSQVEMFDTPGERMGKGPAISETPLQQFFGPIASPAERILQKAGVFNPIRGRVIRMPMRALFFIDGFTKMANAQMAVAPFAYRIARKEGLKGAELEKRVNTLVATPGSLAWEHAAALGQYITARSPIPSREEQRAAEPSPLKRFTASQFPGEGVLDAALDWVAQGRRQSYLIGTQIPFVNIPFNLAKMAAYRVAAPVHTPLKMAAAAAGALPRIAPNFKGQPGYDPDAGMFKMKKGRPYFESYERARQIRDFATGAITLAATALLWNWVAGDGNDDDKPFLITGSAAMGGDEKKRGLRELTQRAYGGPFVMRFGGRNGWSLNYGKYEPAATVLGALADTIINLKRVTRGQETPREAIDALGNFLGSQIQEKSFLRGVGNIMRVINGELTPTDFAKQAVLSWMVPGLVRAPLRNLDDAVRDQKGATFSQLLTGNLPQKIDVYGRPMEKTGNAFSRMFTLPAVKPDEHLQKADELLLRWNNQHPDEAWAPSTPVTNYHDAQGKSVQMSPEQRTKFLHNAGVAFLGRLRNLGLSTHQVEHPREEDVKAIQTAHREALEQVKREMFPKRTVNLVKEWLSKAA